MFRIQLAGLIFGNQPVPNISGVRYFSQSLSKHEFPFDFNTIQESRNARFMSLRVCCQPLEINSIFLSVIAKTGENSQSSVELSG
jgi:hypothetical protein